MSHRTYTIVWSGEGHQSTQPATERTILDTASF